MLTLHDGMDLLLRVLIRASIWIRRPPSRERLYAIIAVALLVAVVFGLEAAGLWPEWATREPPPRSIVR